MRNTSRDGSGFRCLRSAVAATGLTLASCASYRMVSTDAYDFAQKPTSAIVDELSPKRAYKVLVDLGRIRRVEGNDFEAFLGGSEGDGSPAARLLSYSKSSGRPESAPSTSVTKPGTFFSTLTAIAVEDGLEATAIPGIALGMRPDWNKISCLDDSWFETSGMSFDLIVGGAVAPGGNGENTVDLALGTGLTFPWAENGAFSLGAVVWRPQNVDDDSTEIAAFFAINFGNFKVADNAK